MSEMTPERWQKVTALLEDLLPEDASKRSTLLRGLCADDDELRREVESLLSYEDLPVSFLEEPLVAVSVDPDENGEMAEEVPPQIGTRIGPYRILRRLGVGGMGAVFLAEREDGFQKRVALKQIRRRQLSEEVRFRFENERQILADLEHPNIARILDGGSTADELPYFVMEYIDGEPIDRFCDEQRLALRQRIELVLQVCSALQVAHQNLVVHRDLKPSNILVTKDAVPKLIDFGIAKHLEPESALHELATEVGCRPMTLRYASPEQLHAGAITTAADVYSLGVLLYQLLTGHDPYACDQGRPALYRAICDQPPLRPSLAVEQTSDVLVSEKVSELRTPESIGWLRNTRPQKLKAELTGDLDSILLKTLRKSPENRYRSMEHLANDLQRFLDGLPVSARDGTFHYRAGKFVRRHWLAMALVGSLFLVLTAFALTVMSMWRQANEEKALGALSRSRAERTRELLVGLLEVFAPDEKPAAAVGFLINAETKISRDLSSEPALLAGILNDPLAKLYRQLGLHERALAVRKQALEVWLTHQSEDHPKTTELLLNLGSSFFHVGDYSNADEYLRQAFEMRRRLNLGDAEFVAPLSNQAASLFQRGKFEAAADLYSQALDIQRELYGEEHPRMVRNLRNLGKLNFTRGDFGQAEKLLRQALAIELKAGKPTGTSTASIRSALGRLLHALGRLDEAADNLDEARSVRNRLLEPDHQSIARVERNLAAVLLESGDLRTSYVLLLRAQSVLRRHLAPEDWEIAELDGLIGVYLLESGQYEEAEVCLIDSYESLKVSRGPGVIYTEQALGRLLNLYDAWERPGEASKYLDL